MSLEAFEAELIAGIHERYGYRGDHTRTKMQVFDVDYTIQNIRITPEVIYFDVVLKPSIMYAFGAKFAPWEGEDAYRLDTEKCPRSSRLVTIPMQVELLTWQKNKYSELATTA
jgi:hypothetical protein